MIKFCRYFEKGKLLLEISNSKYSFDILMHYGEVQLFWIRKSKVAKYFEFTISDFVVLCTHRNSFKILGLRTKIKLKRN